MAPSSDIRIALRMLARAPGFTLLATGILATGIGLTLYMFGAINGFVLRPLPYADADRLVHVELRDPGLDRPSSIAYPDFAALRATAQGARDLTAFYEGTLNVADEGGPERLDGVFASGNLFSTLGQQPLIGRALVAADSLAAAPPVLVLSQEVWERRYASDPAVVGRAIRINGQPATIVGVMPAGFRFPLRTEAWTAIPARLADESWRDAVSVEVIGHLEPGVSQEGLAAELDAAFGNLDAADPSRPRGSHVLVKPLAEEWVGARTRQQIGIMFVAVVLVLLIACANVANLLYARGLGRQRDLAVRAALGASRRRLLVLGLTEALVVGLLATAVALPLSQAAGVWTMESLRANEDMEIPTWVEFEIDARSIAFTLGIALAAAIAAGTGPALAGSRANPQSELRAAGRGTATRRRRGSRFLVIAQIALSFGLVTCAALGARSLARLYAVDAGVDGSRILGGRVALFEESHPDASSRLAFFTRAEERLRDLPGVAQATVTSSLPATFWGGARIEVEGQEAPSPGDSAAQRFAGVTRVSPSFFATMGVELTAGRLFSATDGADAPRVAIVNQRFAATFLPGLEPLGRRLRIFAEGKAGPWISIVGVAPNLQHREIDDSPAPTFYIPLAQDPPRFAFLAIRSATGDASVLAPSLRKAVAEIDPDQPVYFLRTIDDWISIVRYSNRFLAGVFGAFAFAGLLLAAVGVYGVSSYAVTQRTAEIGLRRALGAENRAVVRLVTGRSLRDLGWGLLLGLGLAVALGRQVANFFYEVPAFDPVTYATVPLVLLGAILFASLVPVRRALAIEPAAALREE